MAKEVVVCAVVDKKLRLIRGEDGLPGTEKGEREWFLVSIKNRPVVIGRETYERYRAALPCEMTFVLTSKRRFIAPDCRVIQAPAQIGLASVKHSTVIVAGGQKVYEKAFSVPGLVDRICLLVVKGSQGGPWKFSKDFFKGFKIEKKEKVIEGKLVTYVRKVKK